MHALVCGWQKCVGAQSASTEQVVLHAPAAHRTPAEQVCGDGVTHAPALQVLWPMKVVLSTHVGPLPHAPMGYVHAPSARPVHVPTHGVPAPAQARAPCGAPSTTREHVPTEPALSQAWQDPVHAVLQQTWSTQNPLAHSVSPAHV